MNKKETIQIKLKELENNFNGDIYIDKTNCLLYATDASVYREIPLAVTRPKDKSDIKKLIDFAAKNNTSITPRTAGTSLAGQVVSGGIIADVSKYMTNIIELNTDENWVRVQPGVILDEMNLFLKKHNLFFCPETSTSNRCMIGGMVGNNSCGAHSIVYGSTREHTISTKAILSDGTEAEFKPLTKKEFLAKCNGNSLENKIYRNINEILSKKENQIEIRKEFPDKKIKRRNTGYAIDLLLESEIFSDSEQKFNFSKIIAGSEGTLAFITEIKLNLIPLSTKEKGLVCVHLDSLEDAFHGNLIALKFNPIAVEMIDDVIIECTKNNIEQQKNRFFIKGKPKALLFVEFEKDSKEEINNISKEMEDEMRKAGYGFYFPVLFDDDIQKVWNLRKAGLGLLSNIPGDAKPVAMIEDAAVAPEHLPDYMKELKIILDKYGKSCVYYAHIDTGELHLRPILNLKNKEDVKLFHDIALDAAKLVKKYNGSLSGEHGDGRLRGEFIPLIIGEKNYQLLKDIKKTWDPDNIFNPKKIVNTLPMNSNLRYKPGQITPEIKTYFDFSKEMGIVRAAEKCNGSGDCRKNEIFDGTMCPSYMATRDEKNSTRARANILREFLTNSEKENPFAHKEIFEVMDLCLSCKACKSECPSLVDVAKLKAEFLQHYYEEFGVPLRTKAVAYISKINRLGSIAPRIFNFFMKNKIASGLFKNVLGFSNKRNFPLLEKTTLKKWVENYVNKLNSNENKNGKVYLFADEFTNYNDSFIGIKAVQLLNKLGYKVVIPAHVESGRALLSKGLLKKAKKNAIKNIKLLKDIITEESPLIGIEPSAILSFRDEYPELVDESLKKDAGKLAASSFMFDEFFINQVEKGKISKELFTDAKQHIKFHGHCQQKAIASTNPTLQMLSFPKNYTAEEIPSGCCGMAGSFGYEKEHYELSMKIGELILFPEIRKTEDDTIIAATGTSCRCQIEDGTGRRALHPVEVLFGAMVG